MKIKNLLMEDTERHPTGDVTELPKTHSRKSKNCDKDVYMLKSPCYGYYTGSEKCGNTNYPTWSDCLYDAKIFKTKKSAINKLWHWNCLRECGCEVIAVPEKYTKPINSIFG